MVVVPTLLVGGLAGGGMAATWPKGATLLGWPRSVTVMVVGAFNPAANTEGLGITPVNTTGIVALLFCSVQALGSVKHFETISTVSGTI